MTIDGDVIEIELSDDIEAVIELKEFVKNRLNYIDTINVVGDKETFTTSSLFQLLMSIKKTQPEINIPILDEGSVALSQFGKLYWIKS
jgi:hypothetical protein